MTYDAELLRQPSTPDPRSYPVTVVIPLYNKVREVRRAVSSVLAQTWTRFRLVVVDDGSIDGGADIVLAFDDPRLRLVRQENDGVSAARNRGVAEAETEFVAFLDADDEWKPSFLDTIVRLAGRYPDCAVFATNYLACSESGECRRRIIRGLPGGRWEGVIDDYFAVAAVSDPPLHSSSLAVRKEALLAVGGFPEGVTSGEDLLTWARLALSFEIAYCTEPQAVFHLPGADARREGRLDDSYQYVGAELSNLLASAPPGRRESLKRYLALWHRMRLSIMLRRADRGGARKELRQAVDLAGWSPRLAAYRVMALLPDRAAARVAVAFEKMKDRRRRMVSGGS